jgi:BTB And C-terminal Kelch
VLQNCKMLLMIFEQVSAVFEACARFMETQLDDSNCVGILCFAHAHNCMHLYGKSLEHIEKNFNQVFQPFTVDSLSFCDCK